MWWLLLIPAVLVILFLYDVLQKRHAILRNFPILGHFRYILEFIGPELRQYIVASNDEERPFNRDERSWVYASAKKQNNYFGFGTDNDPESSPNFLIIKHSPFPLNELRSGTPGYDPKYQIPSTKILGQHRGRAKAFRPKSVVNISAMSYGSLSAAAVEALNRGSAISECLHNTGEGGVASHHQHGGELIWQIGTGYFGCRTPEGKFDMKRFVDTCQANPIRAIEVKLSQGAKPGMGGVLPAGKITPEISKIRGIPMGQDCLSPNSHSSFHDVDSMLDFVESLADATGLPVGIKSAVGQSSFWSELAKQMETTERGVDFIAVDGGEGGTGAGPLVFADHVALPFKLAMVRVYREFIQRDLQDKITFVGAGKLGFPEKALLGFTLGCDMINIGREAMMAIGCIQAQKCHTGHCPTGVATQSQWLMRGLDPTDKAARLANYVVALRKEILAVCRACGVCHPGLMSPELCEILDDRFGTETVAKVFGTRDYDRWGLPPDDLRTEIQQLMSHN